MYNIFYIKNTNLFYYLEYSNKATTVQNTLMLLVCFMNRYNYCTVLQKMILIDNNKEIILLQGCEIVNLKILNSRLNNNFVKPQCWNKK